MVVWESIAARMLNWQLVLANAATEMSATPLPKCFNLLIPC